MEVADDTGKTIAAAAAQTPVQVGELAALALVTHPDFFPLVPTARTVQQKKYAGPVVFIFLVQFLDSLADALHQFVIARLVFRWRIAKISQQREENIHVTIGEITDLQRLQQIFNACLARQHCRHGHQSCCRRRNAFGKIQSRQQGRFDENGREPVHHGHAQLAGRNQCQQRKCSPHPAGNADDRNPFQQENCHQQTQGEYASQIKCQGKLARDSRQIASQRKPERGGAFQNFFPLAGQKKSDVRQPVVCRAVIFLRQINRQRRDFYFSFFAVACDTFDGVAVKIARRKIHFWINPGRVGAQDFFHRALLLDEIPPVHRVEKTQAADAVADRDLHRGLILAFALHQLPDRQPLLGEPFLDPAHSEFHRRRFFLHPPDKFRDESTRQRRLGFRHLANHDNQVRRIFFRRLQNLIRPIFCGIAIKANRREADGHAAKVLNQAKPQHDGNRPQFAELQGHDFLIARKETGEMRGVNATVRVRNQFNGDFIDARKIFPRAVAQLRQFAVEPAGQMALRRADLLLDQMKIIEQPFRRRRNAPGFFHAQGVLVVFAQDFFIRRQTRQQQVRPPAGLHAPGLREVAGGLLEQVNAQ